MGKKEKCELLVIGGILLLLLVRQLFLKPPETEELRFQRPDSGGKKLTLYLNTGDRQEEVVLRVGEKERTQEELEELFACAKEEILQLLNPEGLEPLRLEQSILLPEELAMGAYLEWTSTDPELVSTRGEVRRGGLTEETRVTLTVRITIGDERREIPFTVYVVPLAEHSAEQRIYLAEKYLKQLEEETRDSQSFTVPTEYEGVSIQETDGSKKEVLPILLLLCLLPCVVVIARRQEKEKQKKLREQELLRGYPQFITKLTLYVGAGLSLRSVWERMAAEYRGRRQKSGNTELIYEELLVLAGELKNGVPEAAAYERFGRRMGLRPYQRCTSLLIGQLEKGSGGLREKLEYEVRLAWDKHRLFAEAAGAEAQTKLLFPMMGMLFLVFAVVMLPALLQMGF